jgi:hypothetical protein
MARIGVQSPNFYGGIAIPNDGSFGSSMGWGDKRYGQNIPTGYGQMGIGGGGGGIQGFLNSRSAGGSIPGSRTAGASGSYSQGYNPGITGGAAMDLQSLISRQQKEFEDARNENRRNFETDRSGVLGSVDRLRMDPTRVATTSLANRLLQNPEAITDKVQQGIVNRGSNLINAAANAAQRQGISGLADRGLANSSAAFELDQQINRDRYGQLANMVRQVEEDRAMRRNQDISNAVGLGRGVYGDLAQMDLGANTSVMNARPQVLPNDMSMYALGLGNLGAAQTYAGMGNQMQAGTAALNQNRNDIMDRLRSMGGIYSQLADRYQNGAVGGGANANKSTYIQGNPFQDQIELSPQDQAAYQDALRFERELKEARDNNAPPNVISNLEQLYQQAKAKSGYKLYNASTGGIY